MDEAIKKHIQGSLKALNLLKNKHRQIEIAKATGEITNALFHGRKILICGNGGSAADAQHLAAELVGRFKENRRSYPAIALTSDSATITAIANDFGYERIFSRQVIGLGKPGDVVIGISTSGESQNVKEALIMAKRHGMRAIAFTGQNGNLDAYAHLVIKSPSKVTAEIQECQKVTFHAICAAIDATYLEIV